MNVNLARTKKSKYEEDHLLKNGFKPLIISMINTKKTKLPLIFT